MLSLLGHAHGVLPSLGCLGQEDFGKVTRPVDKSGGCIDSFHIVTLAMKPLFLGER
ncbi:hypothetical protein GCM10010166_61510 [Couchioplanes caeruleus subsp. azureus]|uniref:hypothetical protein n=1 Tax=Couchioplanes caeruleus TaxID=56438 RepID=UPI001671098C|nr:hypothetical protein GCM10010166_61510 [Couchioplanes caeruleus subsp. azureus]